MIRMNDFNFRARLRAVLLASGFFLLATVLGFGQNTQINLTAGPTTLTLPDGNVVPMWSYFCGSAVTGSTAACAALNPNAPAATATTPAGWSPVVITVPAGTAAAPATLTINLTNNLSFTPTTPAGAAANPVPTSIVIVGQVGGGLGDATQRTTTLPPDHSNAQGCVTWFIASIPPGTPCTATNNTSGAVPPAQGNRVQSFGTEVAAAGATLVLPQVASGSALTWNNLRPGTYLLESGTHPSIQVPMGLIGVLVVTTAPTSATSGGTAYPGAAATATTGAVPPVMYGAELPLEFSEIDPVQNKAVDTAVRTAGFSETMVWSGLPGGCGDPSSLTHNQCYPPAVNYTPFYYLINGVAFNKTNATGSLIAPYAGTDGVGSPFVTGITGTVLVRLVNAGLRMHVPSIVGSLTQGFPGAGAGGIQGATLGAVQGFSLIAEDGNVLPGVQVAGNDRACGSPCSDRRLYGCGQDLRCDDQCARERDCPGASNL